MEDRNVAEKTADVALERAVVVVSFELHRIIHRRVITGAAVLLRKAYLNYDSNIHHQSITFTRS